MWTSARVSFSGSRSTAGSPFSTKKYGDRVRSGFVSSAAPGSAIRSASPRLRKTALRNRFISFSSAGNRLPWSYSAVHTRRAYELGMKERRSFTEKQGRKGQQGHQGQERCCRNR